MTTLQEVYLTTGQAATMLGVNRLTIRRWVAAGRVRGQLVGNVTLIDRQQVEQMAAERSAT